MSNKNNGFVFKGITITDPNMDESGRFEVNPTLYYKESYSEWYMHNQKEAFNQRLQAYGLKVSIYETDDVYDEDDEYKGFPMYEACIQSIDDDKELENTTTGRYCCIKSVCDELESFVNVEIQKCHESMRVRDRAGEDACAMSIETTIDIEALEEGRYIVGTDEVTLNTFVENKDKIEDIVINQLYEFIKDRSKVEEPISKIKSNLIANELNYSSLEYIMKEGNIHYFIYIRVEDEKGEKISFSDYYNTLFINKQNDNSLVIINKENEHVFTVSLVCEHYEITNCIGGNIFTAGTMEESLELIKKKYNVNIKGTI